MYKYKHLLLLTLLLAVGCQQSDDALDKNLNFLNQATLEEYQEVEVSIQNAIKHMSPSASLKITEQQVETVDSLLQTTHSALAESTSKQDIQQILNTWEQNLTEKLNYSEPYFETIPQEFKPYQLLASIKLRKDAVKVMKHIARYVGATEIRFDKLNLIVEPERLSIKLGQSYKAKVYFAATSSTSWELVQLMLDGTPIEVGEDGIGYIEVKPDFKGNFNYKLSSQAKHSGIHSEYYALQREVTFSVE